MILSRTYLLFCVIDSFLAKTGSHFQEDPYILFACLSSINCWRTRWIDQQQQSVASANLATTQQSAFETLLIIAWQSHIPLEVHPRCVCGDKYIYIYIYIYMGLSWDILLCGSERWMVKSWTNIYGTTLRSGDERDWQNIVSCTAISKSDSVRCVCSRVFFSGLFCCVLVPGTPAFHLLYAEYYRSMRKYGFCTYVRSLTNQINAVIHSCMSDSIDWVHLAQLCRRRPARGARGGGESELQVQGVIQTSLSSHLPVLLCSRTRYSSISLAL